MAYAKKRKNNKKTYAQKARELNAFAYKMGLIEKGKKDSNTQVYESFNKGLEAKKRQKKPLI